jgi:hypothetical membrane protein
MKQGQKAFRNYGALLWFLSIQYYITQFVVARNWSKLSGYSWSHNTISDLGNTACYTYGSRYVCSPLHNYMNISFVVLGLTIIGGSYLLCKYRSESRLVNLGFIFMAISGAGTILVGLFPENTIGALHGTGAILAFVFGNIGTMLIGRYMNKLPTYIKVYSVLSGLIGLIALGHFLTHSYVSLGEGGMERIAAYPQSIWMIIIGLYFLLSNNTTNLSDNKLLKHAED